MSRSLRLVLVLAMLASGWLAGCTGSSTSTASDDRTPTGELVVQHPLGSAWPELRQAPGTQNLAPRGMFYISYDTFFDWQLGGSVAPPVGGPDSGFPQLPAAAIPSVVLGTTGAHATVQD